MGIGYAYRNPWRLIGLTALMVLSAIVLKGQPQDSSLVVDSITSRLNQNAPAFAIGLGFMDNSELPGDFIVPIEYGWNRKNSLGAALGVLPFNPNQRSTSSLISLSGTIESRRYVALRGRRLLSGIFVGLCGQFNWARYGYSSITNYRSDSWWLSVGLSLGYQGRIGEHISFGAKVFGVYPKDIHVYGVDRQGNVVYDDAQPVQLVLYGATWISWVF